MLLLYTHFGTPRVRTIFSYRPAIHLILISLFVVAGSFCASAQSDITSLLTERTNRIDQSLTTKDIDLQLFELGARPKAVLHHTVLENGSILLDFPVYLPVRADRTEQVRQRIM